MRIKCRSNHKHRRRGETGRHAGMPYGRAGRQYVRMHMPEYPLDVYTMTIDLNNPYNDVDAFIGKNHAGSTEAMTSAYTRLSTPEHQSIGSINGNFWIVSGQNMDDRLLGQPTAVV